MDEFAAELTRGLIDVGRVRMDVPAQGAEVRIVVADGHGHETELRFVQSLQEISQAITLDRRTWRSTWADRTLVAASVAMLSVHILEALATGPDEPSILRLVPGGVVAE